jgi:hypothetical protein
LSLSESQLLTAASLEKILYNGVETQNNSWNFVCIF